MAKKTAEIKITGNTREAQASIGDLKRMAKTSFDAMSTDSKETGKEVSSAFKKMGIRTEKSIKDSSINARKNFEIIKRSGTASANDIKRAHNVMTAKIKANNRELRDGAGRLSKTFGGLKNKLLGIGLAITGLGFTIKKAFEFAEAGAKLQVQERAFNNFAKSMGANGDEIIAKLEEVSRGTIATSDLIASAGKALLLGLDPTKIVGLLKIARAASKITGESITKQFEDIAIGTGRASKLILDNLGIQFSQGESNKRMAESLGKVVSALTDAEIRQGNLNEVIRAGSVILKNVGEDYDSTSDKIARMKAKTADYLDKLKVLIAEGFDKATPSINAFGSAFINFGKDVGPIFLSTLKFIIVTLLQTHIGFLQVSKAISIVARAFSTITDKFKLTKNATGLFDFAIKELDGRIKKSRGGVENLTKELDKLKNKSTENKDAAKKEKDAIKKLTDIRNENIDATKKQKEALSKLKDQQDRNTESTDTQTTEYKTIGTPPAGPLERGFVGPVSPAAALNPVQNKQFVGPPTRTQKTVMEPGGGSTAANERYRKSIKAFGFKTGGDIPGYGGGDKIPALLEAGEHVIRKEAVQKIGRKAAEAFNRGDINSLMANLLKSQNVQKFAEGGAVKGGADVNVNLSLGNKTFPMRTGKSTADSFVKNIRKTNIIYGRGSHPY